jgi:malto-oligosyltrehalose synthase
VDPTRLNPELGGEPKYSAFVQALREHDLAQLLDIVPNHMGAVTENRWWSDVLRRGPASSYARVYDIDWAAGDDREHLVLPVLGAPLGEVLERHELSLELVDGEPHFRYLDQRFPLAPGTLDACVAGTGPAALKVDLLNRLAGDRGAQLRALLDAQHYRLEYWRSAKPRVNYRRFFVIDELVGVRVEDPAVFALTHALALRLTSTGTVRALRIDHIDGLADPAGYLATLQSAASAGEPAAAPPYVVVEKVLAADEVLPAGWQCAGTTGYDCMRDLGGVLVEGNNAAAFSAVYERFTGRSESYGDIAYRCRRGIVDGPLAGTLANVSMSLFEASGAGGAGIAQSAFDEALRALLASLEVYRTYHSTKSPDPHAPEVLQDARRRVKARTGSSPRVLDFLADLLAHPHSECLPAIERLQQLMPTIQAKGIEDTAAYQYARLLSLNEVGSSPGSFGLSVETFHARNVERHAQWPATLLATATHDHKRGEDVRARLHALSELPGEWEAALERWSSLTAPMRPALVDRHDEYVLHQVLLGAWPADLGDSERASFVERVQEYLVKFVREAATRTTWTTPDVRYEAALRDYAAALLDPVMGAAFLAERTAFQSRLSALGVINSLSQSLLKLAGPGVADMYQGAELWDLSLVDPDNRRPVDYETRQTLLAHVDAADPGELLANWRDGAVKLRLVSAALRLRRQLHPLFIEAEYVPLAVTGEQSRHVVAFARVGDSATVIAAAARLPASLCTATGAWSPDWRDTAILLPEGWPARFRDVITGVTVESGGALRLGSCLRTLPVALLLASGQGLP